MTAARQQVKTSARPSPELAPKVHTPHEAPKRGLHAQTHAGGGHALRPLPSTPVSPKSVIPLDDGDFQDF